MNIPPHTIVTGTCYAALFYTICLQATKKKLVKKMEAHISITILQTRKAKSKLRDLPKGLNCREKH